MNDSVAIVIVKNLEKKTGLCWTLGNVSTSVAFAICKFARRGNKPTPNKDTGSLTKCLNYILHDVDITVNRYLNKKKTRILNLFFSKELVLKMETS